jgi:hypothetical protein
MQVVMGATLGLQCMKVILPQDGEGECSQGRFHRPWEEASAKELDMTRGRVETRTEADQGAVDAVGVHKGEHLRFVRRMLAPTIVGTRESTVPQADGVGV